MSSGEVTDFLDTILDLPKKKSYNRLMKAQGWNYKLGKCIGAGGFGRVYELLDSHDSGTARVSGRLQRKVVKIIDLNRIAQKYGEDQKYDANYFYQEIDTMQEMADNGCAAKLLDYAVIKEEELPFGEEGNHDPAIFFLVMPRYNTFPKDAKLPEAEVIQMGYDICEALKALVAQGKSHRDLRPANIFYDDGSNRYILGDFGITKAMVQSTNTHIVRKEYNAPEFYDPKLFSEAKKRLNSDLYSLAVTMARFLACPAIDCTDGGQPFKVLDFDHFKGNRMACPALLEIMEKGLRPYDQRYQTPAEMQADLKVLLDYVNKHGGNVPVGMNLDELKKIQPVQDYHAKLAKQALRWGNYQQARSHSMAGHEQGDPRCTALLAYSSFHLIRQGVLGSAVRVSMEQMLHDAYGALETKAMGIASDEKRREMMIRAASMKYLLAVSKYETGDQDAFMRLAGSAAAYGSVISSYVCGRGMYAGDRPFKQDKKKGWELLVYAAEAGYGAALAYVYRVSEQDPNVTIPPSVRRKLNAAGTPGPEHRLEDILREL